MQFEICCSYFVQKVGRTENKTQKSGGHVPPIPHGICTHENKPCAEVSVHM